MMAKTIFVFGSNLAGIHGAGSAAHAKRYYGAVMGQGMGRTGDAYAIPTKSARFRFTSLPLDTIAMYVDTFLTHATVQYKLDFRVVAIGCGLAGYTPEQIAPMFRNAPSNVNLPKEFLEVLHRA